MRFNPIWIAFIVMFLFSGAFFILPLLFVGAIAVFALFVGGARFGSLLGRIPPLWGALTNKRVRANLAILHAAENVLAEKYSVRLDGYPSERGFFISGTEDAGAVYEAASQALARLKSGEKTLSVCAWCGLSRIAAAAAVFVVAAFLLPRFGLDTLTALLLGAAAAYFASPYLSPYAQTLLLSKVSVSGSQIQGTDSVSRTVSSLGGRVCSAENGVETIVSDSGAIEAEIIF